MSPGIKVTSVSLPCSCSLVSAIVWILALSSTSSLLTSLTFGPQTRLIHVPIRGPVIHPFLDAVSLTLFGILRVCETLGGITPFLSFKHINAGFLWPEANGHRATVNPLLVPPVVAILTVLLRIASLVDFGAISNLHIV